MNRSLSSLGVAVTLLTGSVVALAQPAAEAPAQPSPAPNTDESPPAEAPPQSETEPTASPREAVPPEAVPTEPAPAEPAPAEPDTAESPDPREPPESPPVLEEAPSLDSDPKEPPPDPTAVEVAPEQEPVVLEVPVTPDGSAASEDAMSDEVVEVTVVGTRLQHTAGSAHVVKQRQLERFELDDPHAVLLSVPGVYVRQEDALGLRPNIGLRGGNADRSKKVTLMEDGILFGPAPYSAPAAYYFPLMTRMAAIRVIKGPGAIAYGPQTIGGAVDLLTRAIPYSPSGALDLALGEYGYQKLHGHFGASTEQVGFLVEGVRLYNSGFKQLPGGADTGATRNEWMVKGSYLIDPTAETVNEIRLKLGYSDEVSNETYLGLTDADFEANPDLRYPASALDQMKNHRTSLALSHVLERPEQHLKLTTTAYKHEYARAWRKLNRFGGSALQDVLANPDDPLNAEFLAVLSGERDSVGGADTLFIGPNDREFTSQGIQSTFEYQSSLGPITQRLETSLRLHYDSIQRLHTEKGYLIRTGQLTEAGGATRTSTDNEASTTALAAYAADAFSWQRLTFTPGIRVELIASRFENFLSAEESDSQLVAVLPGAGLFYALTDSLGVLGGVSRGFSPPPPGNDDIDPEYSVNYEAGARLLEGQSRAEVIGFFSDYSNLSEICTASSGCENDMLDQQFNAGAAQIRGLEVYLEHAPSVSVLKLPMSAAYTFTQTEFLTSFESQDPIFGSVQRGDELPYVPSHQFNLTLGVEAEFGGIAASLNYIGATREQPGTEPLSEVTSTDEQLWLDLSASGKVTSWFSLYANVRNVLDARYLVSHRPYGARPNAPRWIQVGAKFEL